MKKFGAKKVNYWQNDSFVNLAIFFIDQYFAGEEGGGEAADLISSAYFFLFFILNCIS